VVKELTLDTRVVGRVSVRVGTSLLLTLHVVMLLLLLLLLLLLRISHLRLLLMLHLPHSLVLLLLRVELLVVHLLLLLLLLLLGILLLGIGLLLSNILLPAHPPRLGIRRSAGQPLLGLLLNSVREEVSELLQQVGVVSEQSRDLLENILDAALFFLIRVQDL